MRKDYKGVWKDNNRDGGEEEVEQNKGICGVPQTEKATNLPVIMQINRPVRRSGCLTLSARGLSKSCQWPYRTQNSTRGFILSQLHSSHNFEYISKIHDFSNPQIKIISCEKFRKRVCALERTTLCFLQIDGH